MLNWMIDVSLRNRLAVVVGALLLFAGAGAYALLNLDIDAFPDTTPVQVQVNTIAPPSDRKRLSSRSPFPSNRR